MGVNGVTTYLKSFSSYISLKAKSLELKATNRNILYVIPVLNESLFDGNQHRESGAKGLHACSFAKSATPETLLVCSLQQKRMNRNFDRNDEPCIMIHCASPGEVAEWSKAQHWKCCNGVTCSRVRIPPSPLEP